MSTYRQIVVGYDSSPDARVALDWAIREAASRHLEIRLVHCEPDLVPWDASAATMSGAQVLTSVLPHDDPAVLAAAAEQVAQAGLLVEVVSAPGSPASALVQASRSAAMVVIGSRGHGALASAVLGSTVSHVASHARCPVIVTQGSAQPGAARGDDLRPDAPDRDEDTRPVVVGVDGSPDSPAVLRWAIDHAARHGLALEVLHSYAIPVYPGVVPYIPPVEISEATAGLEQRVTAELLAGLREEFPDVPVTTNVGHGRPAPALIEASGRASLTVVGSHGRGAFLGMLLGSTSQSLLHHARGSVAVIPRVRP